MPFTPSHAVVALPFVRTPLVPAAIAIGAMTPDLPLFVRFGPLGYGRTHDLAWLPATMLVGLALLLVWRCVLRPAARELSPRWLAARLPDDWDRAAAGALRDTLAIGANRQPSRSQRWAAPWSTVALLLASLAIGVASHIVWDLFTHEGRWGVAAIPALDAQWGPLLGYKWLQYGSSLAGLLILGTWSLRWLRRRHAAAVSRLLPPWVRRVWWMSLPVVLAIAWFAGLTVSGPFDAAFTPQHLAYRVLPPACAVWGTGTGVLALAVQSLRAGRRPAEA
ncbi:DUF4184 family protein [Microbacterium sp. BK668]|uniref:DUF4184 family protein n=1 Tax=Microbacterium sp. BK668 TaxID=2512118 RepID=UPI00105B5246|nr:DUF4184 family protein [Microbacterium sp. BK668]TDN88678.1 uncharacterized protein DUF4184 [Microbacterium sp. BK668]